jgi:hypothetical protein
MTRDVLFGRAAVVLTASCVVAVAVTVVAVAKPTFGAAIGLKRHAGVGYNVGDRMDLPPDVLGGATHSVLIFARFDCQACQAARASLADLVADLQQQTDVRAVMLTSRRDRADQERFGRSLGLVDSQVVPVDFTSMRIKAVPAVVVVDRAGMVVYARAGPLSHSDQVALIRKVTSSPGR